MFIAMGLKPMAKLPQMNIMQRCLTVSISLQNSRFCTHEDNDAVLVDYQDYH